MKKTIFVLILSLCLCLLCACSLTPAPKPTATPKPTAKPTATPKPYKAPIVGNDGLLVMSPEEYLGIESCDDLYQDDISYSYQYTDRGYEWHGEGTSNPVDWYKIEDYVDALVASGYYEICDYRDEGETQDYYSLSYIGPGSVKRTFTALNSAKRGAIFIRNWLGDINIYYSLDITTNDLEDTQYRLNEYIFGIDPNSNDDSGDDPRPTARPTEKPPERCSICGGSGERNCSTCGGSGYTGYGSDRHKCPSFNCHYGKVKCWTCGGDGKK